MSILKKEKPKLSGNCLGDLRFFTNLNEEIQRYPRRNFNLDGDERLLSLAVRI